MPDDNITPFPTKKPRKPRSDIGQKRTPEQKAAWKAAVMKSNNKPAQGAKVLPDKGGGVGTFYTPATLIPGQPVEKRARSMEKKLNREIALENAYLTANELMHHGEHEGTRLAAATKLKEWIEGTSVQRTITADVSDAHRLKPQEIENRLAELARIAQERAREGG